MYFRNLVDAANVAALAALLTFRRPECTVGGEDGQEVTVHPPEVFLSEDLVSLSFLSPLSLSLCVTNIKQVREPLSLIIHHLPVAVTFGIFCEQKALVLTTISYISGLGV